MEQVDIKVKDIAAEYGKENKLNAVKARQEVNAMMKTLGIKPHKVGTAACVPEDRAHQLRVELSLPVELQLRFATAKALHPAKNDRYVFAKVDGFEGKHPVLLPRRYGGKISTGKFFTVEVVEDATGVTFRHEWFHKTRHSR